MQLAWAAVAWLHPAVTTVHPLDNPAWNSLTGPHAHVALGSGKARRYPADMSPFMAISDITDAQAWADLAALAAPGETVLLCEHPALVDHLPEGWAIIEQMAGVQLVAGENLKALPDPEALELGAEDVADMLALVELGPPGPFEQRTRELGTYLGLRYEGALVAMAGERMHPPGWVEISAVATNPNYRGRGFAGRLVRAVAHGVLERGETPMLHAAAFNQGAIRLYESLGFVLRREPAFFALSAPTP